MDERGIAPNIAVITNISPDHLDTYDSFGHYAATKRSIAAHQNADDVLILNGDDALVMEAAAITPATVICFGETIIGTGIRVRDDRLDIALAGLIGEIALPANDALRGRHMRMNAAAAAAAALTRGASLDHVAAGLARYRGVANRMERVAEVDGLLFINDTAATAPAAAIASLEAFSDRRIHLIAGGADKNLDMRSLADSIVAGATTVTLLDGTATPVLHDLIRALDDAIELPIAQSMAEAIELATRDCSPGEVVLLSPGCASFGLFRDEFDRGQQFRDLVNQRQTTGARS